jgi:hypothetical protein
MQRAGGSITFDALTADTVTFPSGDDGMPISLFGYGDKAPDAVHTMVGVTGTTPSGVVGCWGRHRATGLWGPCGENGGLLNFGEPITQTSHFTIRDIAAMDRLAFTLASLAGTDTPTFTPVCTALFSEPSP